MAVIARDVEVSQFWLTAEELEEALESVGRPLLERLRIPTAATPQEVEQA